jgi:hypothetical protein
MNGEPKAFDIVHKQKIITGTSQFWFCTEIIFRSADILRAIIQAKHFKLKKLLNIIFLSFYDIHGQSIA